MTQLVKYEAARQALIEAASVDEVKYIHDMAAAAAAYARQAKDDELLSRAIEIRKRAERRAGELLIAMADSGERAIRGQAQKSHGDTFQPKTLSELAISKMQSKRWQDIARLSEQVFEERIAASKKEASRAAEQSRAERQAEKKERRAAREADLGAKQCALPDKRYGVIHADNEARFEVFSRETGMDRAPENHYPTSDWEALKARDVASIAADDCVLFTWAWMPNLPQCLEVMAAWGFAYKSHSVWVKDKIGPGYWFREQHELLLIGTKGDIPAPAMGDQFPSVIQAPRGRHSEKPACVFDMIDAYFPTLPKIELNSRGEPHGPLWDVWGNEAVGGTGAE